MMKVRLPVFSNSSLFCCVFVSIFLVNTLVSLPYQIDILLAFKDEFPSPTCRQTVLSSWTRNTPQDTNSFDGVVFDNETGVVTELHLDEACLRGTIKTNSSLFRFLHLRYLDLSYNNFESSSFPAEFGRLANLEVLKVRDNGLVGEVPSSIHNLSRLTFLDLSKNKLSGGFPLVYNLTKLSSLDLSFNKFSGTIPSSLLTMPSLLKLDLRQNHLRDSLELLNSSSSSKLESLYLGRNFFTGRILEPISKLVKLTDLDLSFLNMIYPISIVFLPLKSLKYLDLSGNSVSRLNTSSDHALTKLIELNLSNCNIVEFPNYLATLQSLEYLDLSGNSLSRFDTSSDQALTKLIELTLSNCNIDEFPKNLKTLQNLQHLDISNNRLKGKVPGWLWNLPLTRVSLSHNSLDGFEGSPEVLLNSSLEMLDLSSNAFGGSFPILPRSMEFMFASKNHFTGSLPLSFYGPRKLSLLDLSYNNFSGPIPLSLCSSRKLSLLDLSYNNLSGPIPRCFGSIDGTMYLHHNNLNGKLPDMLGRNGSLTRLDVSHNQITGKLPDMLGRNGPLTRLVVRHNQITGKLPDTLCRSASLTTVDVGHNQITGELPRSLGNCTGLEILNVESNHITDTFPFWLKALPLLKVIVLRSNRFHGPITSPQEHLSFPQLRIIDISLNSFTGMLPPNYFVNWSRALVDNMGDQYMNVIERRNVEGVEIPPVYAVDFSGNKLGGQIPESIGLLKSLVVFNLSNNEFTGHIPSSFAKLTKLESLDLCRNQLSGKIPQELATLSFLSYINMSHNRLTGQIPQGTQFGVQPESSFEGNMNLCGIPLPKSCKEKNGSQTQQVKPMKQEHVLNSEAATIGYGPTLMMCGLGIIKLFGF